ncbi:hypothetical protein M2650_11530 [Luteimonas sp. SX5]|uniref:Uncharacterized protein n=1 Tax=Luteimonas galliterrae TaxID=2940486 RepID=A0ABT0MK64_9GAMM|nr:hypothetical protein [Luteimonas galliterrae]MCL1635256.1 hypothetical protein [Luteimonas galliterrae]
MNIKFLSLVMALVTCSRVDAESLGASPWTEISFKNENGDGIIITVDNKRNLINKISIKNERCSGNILGVSVPGVISLNGVEFLEDKDENGKKNILTIPFLKTSGDSQKMGTLALSIRQCTLIASETY